MPDAALLAERIGVVILNSAGKDVLSCGCEEKLAKVNKLLASHPTLKLYTVASWGTETWIFRGMRSVNPLGYVLGVNDLGEDFRACIHD